MVARERPVRPLAPTSPSALSKEVVGTVIGRPDLWVTALGVVRRLAVPGWWRSRPYLPLPAPGLWAFRMITAYGRADANPAPGDVISYLEWCRSTSISTRHGTFRPSRSGRRRPGTLACPQSG